MRTKWLRAAALRYWLQRFLPGPIAIDGTERLRACSGALLGILVTGGLARLLLGSLANLPLLIAPTGASAVLLFAVPSSPLAQTWSILGGNMVAATAGVACAHWIHDPLLAAAVAATRQRGSHDSRARRSRHYITRIFFRPRTSSAQFAAVAALGAAVQQRYRPPLSAWFTAY